MALFEDLPVYRITFELLRFSYRVSVKMQRTYRFTLGESLQKDCKDLLICIYRANCEMDKAQALSRARELVIAVQLLIRVANDEGAINSKDYLKASDMLQSAGKQLTAWHKSTAGAEGGKK
jgi:hypothetical protein